MDNLNQLGKGLKQGSNKSTRALKRTKKIIPQVERVRDIVDSTVPVTLEFKILHEDHRVLLDLNFMPPPKTGCCAGCFCSVCEFFDGGITETEVQLTYAYVPGTVVVFKNDIETQYFEETDPQLALITLWAHNDEDVIVCYVYDTCI